MRRYVFIISTCTKTWKNFAARIVCDKRKYDHITPILSELKWLRVKDYLYYRDAILTYKCMNGLTPSYLSTKFTERKIQKKYNTRSQFELYPPKCRTETGKRSFLQRGCNIWNNLKPDIRESSSIAFFKHSLLGDLKRQDTNFLLQN